MADDTKTLVRGKTTIRARDTSPDTLTVDVTDTVVTTTSRQFFRVSAACPTQEYFETMPDSETPFTGAYQFFRDRDAIAVYDEDFANYELQTLAANSFSELGEGLAIYLPGDIEFDAWNQAYGDTDSIPLLSNSAGGSSYLGKQDTAGSRAIYRTDNLAFGNPAIDFDGSDDFYTVFPSDVAPVLSSEGDFFIEVAVQLDTIAGDQAIFAQFINSAGNGSFLLHYNAGFKVELIADGTLADVTLTTGAVVVDELNHLVIQRIGSTFELYLNGTLADSVTEGSSRQILQAGSLVAAQDTGGATFDGTPGNYLDGKLANLEVRDTGSPADAYSAFDLIYGQSIDVEVDNNVASFYDARISPWVTNASNVNYLGDLTGNSESTQVSTSTAYRPTFTENFYNGNPVLNFDGSLDYVELVGPPAQIAANASKFTITCLCRPTSTSGVDYILSFNTATGGNVFLFGYNASTDRFVFFDEDSGTTYDSANTFVQNVWYLITVVHGGAGTNYQVYIDGVLEIDQLTNGSVSGSDRYLLGAELDAVTSPSDYFLGQVAFHAIASSNLPHYRNLFESYAIGAFQNPEDLAGAYAVFEADTPGVAYVNADPVTDWIDLTANSNDAAQGTAAAQPSYTDPALNGFPAMTFDGDDSLVIPGAVSNTAGSDLTIVAFAENTSGTAGTILTTEENLDEGFAFGFDGSNDLLYEHGGFAPQVIEDFGLTSPEPVGARRQSLDAEVDHNAKFYPVTTIAGFTAATDLNTRIGNSTIQPGFTGNLYELAIFERPLTDGEARGIAYGYNLKYSNYAIAQPAVANTVFEFDALAEVGYVDNDNLATLVDQSGTGNATQGTASSRATYRATLIAKQPTLFFDSTDFYTTATTPNTGAGVRTFAFVGAPYYLGGDSIVFSYGPTASPGEAFTLYYDGGDNLWYVTDNETSVSMGRPTLTAEVLIGVYDGTNLILYRNGQEVANTAIVLNTQAGTALTIGDDNLGANTLARYHGWMSYLLVANTALSASEVSAYTDYLARRFKLAI